MARGKVIYKRGEYAVLPIVMGYIVCDASGREVYPCGGTTLPLDVAIDTCDEIAETEIPIAA